MRNLEAELDQLRAEQVEALTVADRDRLMMLGRDLTQAWDSPGATAETRKKIIRTVITEIIVDVVGDSLELLIHWQGGDHTRLGVKKNKFGHTRWVTDTDIVDLVRALVGVRMPDHAIAMVLNRSRGKRPTATVGPAAASARCAITTTSQVIGPGNGLGGGLSTKPPQSSPSLRQLCAA